MSDHLHLVIDGIDDRTHYVEAVSGSWLDEASRGLKDALSHRAKQLVKMDLAADEGTKAPIISVLERRKVERIGKQIAADGGLPYGLTGIANLISGRFAMLEDHLGSSSSLAACPQKRVSQYIGGSFATMDALNGISGKRDDQDWWYEPDNFVAGKEPNIGSFNLLRPQVEAAMIKATMPPLQNCHQLLTY